MNNQDTLKQTFNSPNVNLEIKSFKDIKTWKEIMVNNELISIFQFIKWIVPVDIFNIHGFENIKRRFMSMPTNQRIFDFLQESENYYLIVRINLHAPLTDSHIFIFNSKEEALISGNYLADTTILRQDDKSFTIKNYIDPYVSEKISLLNPFSFYQEFSKYIALGNSNGKKRTFIISDKYTAETDKMAIGRSKIFNWRGAAFENSIPVKDRRRSKYHQVAHNVNLLKDNISFFESFQQLHRCIESYLNTANNEAGRIRYAERFTPIPYTKSDYLMREMRRHFTRLSIRTSDLDKPITPYLEIGNELCEFVYGITSR